jgi:hypothetical protein
LKEKAINKEKEDDKRKYIEMSKRVGRYSNPNNPN